MACDHEGQGRCARGDFAGNADTPRPDVVYSTEMSVTLGSSRVELIHLGPAHSDDMTVLLFPQQRTVFGVDLLHVKRFPVSLNGYLEVMRENLSFPDHEDWLLYEERRISLITEAYQLLTGQQRDGDVID